MLGRIKSYFFKGKQTGFSVFHLSVGWWSQSVPLIAKTFRVENAGQIVLNPVLSTGAVVEDLTTIAYDSDVRVATTGPPTSTWLATIYDIACATFA